MVRTNFGSLMVEGKHRHVILQAHANLGLPEETERNPDGSRKLWAEGDSDRFEAECERIASSPQEVADAVERFGPEVLRRQMAESQARWGASVIEERAVDPNALSAQR